MRGKNENHEELTVKQEYDDNSWTEPILKSGINALLGMSPVLSGHFSGKQAIVLVPDFLQSSLSLPKPPKIIKTEDFAVENFDIAEPLQKPTIDEEKTLLKLKNSLLEESLQEARRELKELSQGFLIWI